MERMLNPMYPIIIDAIVGYPIPALRKESAMGTIASILWAATNIFLLAVTGAIVGAAISSSRGAKRMD